MELTILEILQGLRSEPLTLFFSWLTYLGTEVVVIPVLCIILWCISKETGYRLGILLLVTIVVTQILKVVWAVPRPSVRWPLQIFPVEHAVKDALGYSRPSGHTTTAMAFYPSMSVYLFRCRTRKAALTVSFIIIMLVAVSRVYLGVHTVSDVLISIPVAAAVIALVWHGFSGVALAIAAGAAGVLFVVSGGMWEDARHIGALGGAVIGFVCGWSMERRWIRWNVRAALPMQAAKVIIGLGVIYIWMHLSDPVFLFMPFDPVLADSLRYALITLWATAGLPFLFTWLSARIHHNRDVTPTPRSC